MEDLETLIGQHLEMKFLEVDEEEERCVFSARNAQSAQLTSSFKVQGCKASDAPGQSWKHHCRNEREHKFVQYRYSRALAQHPACLVHYRARFSHSSEHSRFAVIPEVSLCQSPPTLQ